MVLKISRGDRKALLQIGEDPGGQTSTGRQRRIELWRQTLYHSFILKIYLAPSQEIYSRRSQSKHGEKIRFKRFVDCSACMKAKKDAETQML